MDSENSFHHLIEISPPTLRLLREAALDNPSGGEAIDTLREAGYSGGRAIFEAFDRLVFGETGRHADALTVEEFTSNARRFFESSGWGGLEIDAADETFAVASVTNSWESEAGAGHELPSCHLTTGSLAAFFEPLADYPVAVFERSCRSAGGGRCEFVIGNSEMVDHVFDHSTNR